ncbi:MAG: leucine--tRNA ligase [Bacteroidota bacterium]
MGNYDYTAIEAKWQKYWAENRTFAIEETQDKPKYYVLDMFPYPSGKGLHVGHPLGYIATDIVARFRKLQGYNVLHPMGYDAFGLPAEQYAIETGQHPAVTTAANIETFKGQLSRIGLVYHPESSQLQTCDPDYYRWTQWIFLQIFHSWYNLEADKAEPIATLVERFVSGGSAAAHAHHDYAGSFSAAEWQAMSAEEQAKVLLDYRMAYNAYTEVNWCPALGTVLANDEVINGVSERGGHPVERKPMRQWAFRMRAYADRLLDGLNQVDWPDPIKEMQRNWIGRSEGARIAFDIAGQGEKLEVFSTRPDTIFGATFMVLAPEHPLVEQLVTEEQRAEVMEYVAWARNRTEVERQQEKKISGKFIGAYAQHPFIEGKQIPIWTADYVLWGYGTGAIMAVPAGDGRDHAFARHFGIEILPIIDGVDIAEEAYEDKRGTFINSDFLNGLEVKEAISAAIKALEERGIGEGQINYRLRDPNFSRQRYWGEPFPVVYRNGIPYAMDEAELPLKLPEVKSYSPGEEGEGPLANVTEWIDLPDGGRRESNTMPGYAGSSWYFLRYFDLANDSAFVSREKADYWMNVDLYIGGSEHAVGHLLYSRYWTKVLYDLGCIAVEEPFGKLVNQGMLQGRSSLMYRVRGKNKFVSADIRESYETDPIHVDVNFVENDLLDLDAVREWRGGEYREAEFVTGADGNFLCGYQVEKMSKRYHNVVNPDLICEKYGADTLRLYEMFLGPLEDSKPWNTNGIEGCWRFLRKAWNLFTDSDNQVVLTDAAPNPDELRILHQTIGKVQEDIQSLSFNTSVAQFMKFANEAGKLKTKKRAVLEPFLITLAPFAPHFAEELWSMLGYTTPIAAATWPKYNAEYTKVATVQYPIQFNGKVRMRLDFDAGLGKAEIEAAVLANAEVQSHIAGKTVRKVIVVPGRIVNIVAN